jgi:hypothetical protein
MNDENSVNIQKEPWNEYTDRTCCRCGRVLPKKAEKHKLPECKIFNLQCIREEEWKTRS